MRGKKKSFMPELNIKNLNPEQKRAVVHEGGPLLIVAGAGTGKTTVITQRIGWLIEQEKCKPDEILALTFTDKAAAEMEERVDLVLPYGYTDLWILTFHSFAEKILKQHALEIGLPNDFKIFDQTQQWLIVRQNLEKFDLDFYRPLGNPTKFIHALVKLFSRAKDELVTPKDYLAYAKNLKLNADSSDFIKNFLDPETIKALTKKERKEFLAQEIQKTEEVANAFHVYQQLLLENNALDFGDLINYSLELFQNRPAILAKYRQKFKYILVDEFQDTNYAQYELVKLLAAPKNNITVVGDDDQSIYKFRGASISNILEFKKDYPKSAEIFLTKNYRSTQNILDLAYQFITQNNPHRLEVKLAKEKDETGKILSKKLIAETTEKGGIKHYHFISGDEEIRGVLEQVAELKSKDEKASWNDFAILARTNEAANWFSQVLSQTQIPHRFLASRGLYTKPVILDILAYLRLLDDYHESRAVYRILNSPVIGLDDKTIVQLNYWSRRKGYSLFATLPQTEVINQSIPEVKEKIRKFVGWVEKHSQLARQKNVSEVVLAFLEDSGYLNYLTGQQNLAMIAQTSYLNQFYQKIKEFEKETIEPNVKNFLALINFELEAGETGSLTQNLDEGPEALKVMTVHAAKGLEFKYVWLVNLVDRRFPSDDRPDLISLPDALIKEILPQGDIHLQEERRLFYVAMTRARRGLFFTSAADYGGARKKKLSRFLMELENFGLPLDQAAVVSADKKLRPRQLTTENSNRQISAEDINYLLPKKFSYTQLSAFKNCPYHYWLEYILKIPQKGKDIFSFGSSIHNTLLQFFLQIKQRSEIKQIDLFSDKIRDQKLEIRDQKPKMTFDELIAIYEKIWIDDWYQTRQRHDEYKAKGKKMLKIFYQEYQKAPIQPKYLEAPFNLVITDKKDSQNYFITGKIDRIDPLNNGLEIIDYKTGEGKNGRELSAEDKEQLLIYQLAAEMYLKEKIEKLSYYYLAEDKKYSFLGTEKDLNSLKQKIIKTINDIYQYPWPAKASDCTCFNRDLSNL